jgi:hypothetical protein
VQISATAYFWRQFYALLTSNSDSEQKKIFAADVETSSSHID